MVRNDRCCVGPCNNDRRYSGNLDKRPHVDVLKWHAFPKDIVKREIWMKMAAKGRELKSVSNETRICSNHFMDGGPTKKNPYPTLLLTINDYRFAGPVGSVTPVLRRSPRKRLKPELPSSSSQPQNVTQPQDENSTEEMDIEEPTPLLPRSAMTFAHLTKDCDVRFFTGFESRETFKTVFEHLQLKVLYMRYWYGQRRSSTDLNPYQRKLNVSLEAYVDSEEIPLIQRKGPARKLSQEQEFLVTMMRLRLGLLIEDLAHRFVTSQTRISQIWITWIKMISKELKCLIIWPSKGQIFATIPACFKKHYPKVRVIIDCSEVFVETPSCLEVHALLWSDYKHHCTFKFLVGITPNGAVSYMSDTYGGRSSDVFMVRDCGFLDILEPYDYVMADRGFKIKQDLLMKRCYLVIPPSAAKGNKMLEAQVKETKQIANVRIFVEQAIKRIKDFRILKAELSLLEMPIFDDILTCCSAFTNLLPPLTF